MQCSAPILAVAALALCWFTPSSGLAQPAAEAELHAVLPANQLRSWMADAGVPGLSISVIHGFEVRWSRGFGVADARSRRSVTPTTLFQAASISKPVMAIAAARLAEQGLFNLDADVADYIRRWQIPFQPDFADRPVTARMLLSHTAGFDDGLGFAGYEPTQPLPSILAILNGEAPATNPAIRQGFRAMSRSLYSGGGSVVMQLLLTDLTGLPFDAVVERTILQPLGLRRSFYQ